MACLRTTLPITFRINGSGKFADALRRRLETDFLAGLVREGQQARLGQTSVLAEHRLSLVSAMSTTSLRHRGMAWCASLAA